MEKVSCHIQGQKGQAAVEFTLAAPFLFIFFFCVIQLSYMAYASLAVQEAALAVARTGSLSSDKENNAAFKTKLALSLYPLAALNKKTMLTVLASQIKVIVSQDDKKVTAQVRYPMPIWVPMVDRIFGQSLVPSFDYTGSPEGRAIQKIFQFLGKPAPDLSFNGVSLPVCWITYQESMFNEGYRP